MRTLRVDVVMLKCLWLQCTSARRYQACALEDFILAEQTRFGGFLSGRG